MSFGAFELNPPKGSALKLSQAACLPFENPRIFLQMGTCSLS